MVLAKCIFTFLLATCANAEGSLQNITVNGTIRYYSIFVPSTAPTGLIVYLAPGADKSYLDWVCPQVAGPVQEQTGAVVVCPATQDSNSTSGGKPTPCWKAFRNYGYCQPRGAYEDSSDVDFLAAMIASIKKQHDVPEGRTIVSGFSNGASMAYRFACERSDLYDGLVIESQAWFDPWVGYYDYVNHRKPTGIPQCKPQHRRPLYTAVGTVDPYYGDHPAFEGAQASVNWESYSTQVLGCTGSKEETTKGPHEFPQGNGSTTCYKYPSCPEVSPSGINIMCVVPGMGHTGGPVPMLLERAFADFFGVPPRPPSPSPPSPPPSPSPGKGDYVCYQGTCYYKPGSGTTDKDTCERTCSKFSLGGFVV